MAFPYSEDKAAKAFWAKTQVDSNGCWVWQGGVVSEGYGAHNQRGVLRVKFGQSTKLAHRVAFMLSTNAPIPSGMTVDHTCHNRLCCNPAHLQLLSRPDNARRKWFSVLDERPLCLPPLQPGQKARKPAPVRPKLQKLPPRGTPIFSTEYAVADARQLVAFGLMVSDACHIVGICRKTYYNFLNKKRAPASEQERGISSPPDMENGGSECSQFTVTA